MPVPTNIQAEFNRHCRQNNERIQALVEQQFNTEITRSFVLTFDAANQSDAEGLGRLLFAKGMRLLTLEPEKQPSSEHRVRAVVKHSLREITQEQFVCDLITVASGVSAIYQGWDLPSEESAEQTQQHNDTPDIQQ